MTDHRFSVPSHGTVAVPAGEVQSHRSSDHFVGTRDHDVIRAWAARHRAEPATGEATSSGPSTAAHVNDGGVGIRFNFPGVARFRPIAWDEWLEHFDRHGLVFVYQEDVADRAFALWQARGAPHGSDLEDWLEAERQMKPRPSPAAARYWFIHQDERSAEG